MLNRSNRRGSLPATLMIIVLVVTTGFLAASLGISSLTMQNNDSHKIQAEMLAESAIHLAIARLQEDVTFGTTGSQPVIAKPPSTIGDAQGMVCFDQTAANNLGIPYSLNNLKNNAEVKGFEACVVPAQSVHLIAIGRTPGLDRRIDVMLRVPLYPYVVSTSGPMSSSGGLQVLGVAGPDSLKNGLDAIPSADIRPGHLLSNFSQSGLKKSVQLSGTGIEISGDVKGSGDVKVDSGVKVGGKILSNAEPESLPEINLADFSPVGKPGVVDLSTGSGDLVLTGIQHAKNSVTFGKLNLKDSVLYVDGDLTVSDGLSGSGAVVVTGKVNITGSGTFTGDQSLAVLAGSDVDIQGQGVNKAEFRGLLYSQGNVRLKKVNLAGVVISNNPKAELASLDVTDSKMVYDKTSTKKSFTISSPNITGTTPQPSPPLIVQAGGQQFQVVLDPTKLVLDSSSTGVPGLGYDASSSGGVTTYGPTTTGSGSYLDPNAGTPVVTGPGDAIMIMDGYGNRMTMAEFDALHPGTPLSSLENLNGNPTTHLNAGATLDPANLNQYLANAVQNLQGIDATLPADQNMTREDFGLSKWTFDLGKYVKEAESMRVVSWKVK